MGEVAQLITESGWYTRPSSYLDIEHYLHIDRGHGRVRRRALCGVTGSAWSRRATAMRCDDCHQLLAWMPTNAETPPPLPKE